MEIYELVRIARYIIIAIGCIGLVVIIWGRRSRRKELLQRGVLIVIISIVLFVCGHVILRSTENRIGDYILKEYYH